MILYTNGCSFTEGYDLVDKSKNWPTVLSTLLNKELYSDAIGGASNDRIFRTTKEYLSVNNPQLVIIGWTQYDRYELSHSEGLYLRCTSSGCMSQSGYNPSNLKNIHKNWLTTQNNFYINYRNFLYNILFLQKYLDSLNINYVFFNAFGDTYFKDFIEQNDTALNLADMSYQWRDRTKYEPHKDIHSEFKELVNLVNTINFNRWIFPYTSMQSFLEMNDHKMDDGGHPYEDGHIRWANEIYNKL